jgi:hypothetical protein
MSRNIPPAAHDNRPAYMITLGLAPPYAAEDVKQAYLEKAKLAHPDRGGSTAAFNEIQQAYERAQEYLAFRGDRRAWIAAKMDHYLAAEKAITRLKDLGASVFTKAAEWLEHSFGDFAQLTESILLIRAVDNANGNAVIRAMVEDFDAIRELAALELPGCGVTDDAVLSLGGFPYLRQLNLTRNPITDRALDVIDALPALETLAIDGTEIGWWSRRRTAARLRRRTAG